MNTEIAPAPDPAAPSLSLAQRIATFRGQSYLALLALLKNPGLPTTDMARLAGVTDDSIYRWRVEMPGFRDTMEAIRQAAGDLRSEYAQAAFREAIPALADAMVERGKGQGVAAQRAAERILETVGVLPKPNAEPTQAPIQVVTHTYLLVQPGKEPQPFMVETTKVVEAEARELPPGKL